MHFSLEGVTATLVVADFWLEFLPLRPPPACLQEEEGVVKQFSFPVAVDDILC